MLTFLDTKIDDQGAPDLPAFKFNLPKFVLKRPAVEQPRQPQYNAEATQKLAKVIASGEWGYNQAINRYLNEGADPNVMVNNKPALHVLIERNNGTGIDLLLAQKANIALLAKDHNATSLALEMQQFKLADQLIELGGVLPQTRFKTDFNQAVYIILKNRNFARHEIADLQVKGKVGSLLHVALVLNDKVLLKKLLQLGVNPLIQNEMNQTSLWLAIDMGNGQLITILMDSYLQLHPTLFKLTDFTFYKAKGNRPQDGITTGGFYNDNRLEKWLLKQPQHNAPYRGINEYVAGGLYRLLLGDTAPQVELVINNMEANFMVGSKLIANFKGLKDRADETYNPDPRTYPYGMLYPTKFNGKPIKGFTDGLLAIKFLGDTDGHYHNVGLIDTGREYLFGKVDHGFALNYNYNITWVISLDDVRAELIAWHGIDNIEKVDFDNLYQSFRKIVNRSFDSLQKEVQFRVGQVKAHMEALQLTAITDSFKSRQVGKLDDNLSVYEQTLLANLRKQQQNFERIANLMDLEKAIIDKDRPRLNNALTKGCTLDQRFHPFFNARPANYGSQETQEITGRQLAQTKWPQLLGDNAVQHFGHRNIRFGAA